MQVRYDKVRHPAILLTGAILLVLGTPAFGQAPAPQWDDPNDMTEESLRQSFAPGPERQFANDVLLGARDQAIEAARHLPQGVNTPGRYGHNALELAVWRGDRAMVAALLAAGANPNGLPYHAPIGFLFDHESNTARDAEIAAMLVHAGADIEGDNENQIAMNSACSDGNIPAIKALLALGAPINTAPEGFSPGIIDAAVGTHWRAVLWLLDHGGSLWAADRTGLTLGNLAESAEDLYERGLVLPDDNAARLEVIERLKQAHSRWPPESADRVLDMMSVGQWPPIHSAGK